MAKNSTVIDVKPKNITVLDLKPQNSTVIDVKPRDYMVIRESETIVYQDTVLLRGMPLGPGFFMYVTYQGDRL